MAKRDKDDSHRTRFRSHLLGNPNYFGNLSELDLPGLPAPVVEKIGDTRYEELSCIGFDPDTDVLAAVVRIKRQGGYGGGPCTEGSEEFVRFFLDYGDGTWIDHGVASFTVHDLPFEEELCYAVAIEIDPKRRRLCWGDPVLPRVRAILSWEDEPPPAAPDWRPVWGNVLERDIQIDPWALLLGAVLELKEKTQVAEIDPWVLDQLEALAAAHPLPRPAPPVAELLEAADPKDASQAMRALYPAMAAATAKKTAAGAALAQQAFESFEIDPSVFGDFLIDPKFDTTYEELRCVGLDRAAGRLYGIVQIKRPSGFSGGLCTRGSEEHVAFYLDFGDGAGWVYQGTGSVTVHDIPDMPKGGLWYQVSIPVDLEAHRKAWCETGRARIRGILSWNTPPAPHDPDHVAHWGDWEDCAIEVEPLPPGVDEGVFTPVLESIGNMPVGRIAPTGYATGSSVGGTFIAEDSPFGGRILLKGAAFFAPGPLEYQITVDDLSGTGPLPFTDPFWASVTTYPSVTPVDVKQVPSGGWFTYLPSATVMVAGGLLGVLKGLDDGPHDIQLHFRAAGGGAILASTPAKRIMVDNTRPSVDVEITTGTGNCGKFDVGETIGGTFRIDDAHCRRVALSVTPSAEAAGGALTLANVTPAAPLPPPAPGSDARNALDYDQTLNGAGLTTGDWSLDTSGMEPCGYNIRVHGVDRTIVNSGWIGWEDWDIEGFCLE